MKTIRIYTCIDLTKAGLYRGHHCGLCMCGIEGNEGGCEIIPKNVNGKVTFIDCCCASRESIHKLPFDIKINEDLIR